MQAAVTLRVGPRLLTEKEAAAYLSMSPAYVRALVARGVIRRVRLPSTEDTGADARRWLIDVRDLDEWIDRLKRANGDPDGKATTRRR